MKLILTLLFFIIPYSVKAVPECGFNVSGGNVTATVLETQQVLQQNFSISRSVGNPKCNSYRLYFSKGLGNSYQRLAYSPVRNAINYNLHSSSNIAGILKDVNDALSTSEFIQANLPQTGTAYANSYFVSLPGLSSQNNILAGNYTDNVQVSLFSVAPNGNQNFEMAFNLTLTFSVNKKVDVSIVDEGAAFDSSATSKVLDFGFLQQNQVLGADIMTTANTSYQVRLSSANNGVMKRGTQNIDYEFRVNGSAVSLSNSQSSPVTIGSGGPTSQGGERFNVKVKILSDTSSKLSGIYEDVITVSVVAN